MNKNFDQREINTGRGAGRRRRRGQAGQPGCRTRLKSLAAQKRRSAEQESKPPHPGPRAKTGPAPARSSCLRQLTSDGLVVLLIFFGFPLICTEVIRHFRRSKDLSLLSDYTAPSSLPVAPPPFPSSPEVKPAPRALLPQKRAEERHGGDALRRESRKGE